MSDLVCFPCRTDDCTHHRYDFLRFDYRGGRAIVQCICRCTLERHGTVNLEDMDLIDFE